MTVLAPGDERLGDVAGVLQPAVADHRHAGRARGAGGVVDRGDLRHADAGDDAGGADGAGPMPTLTPSAPASTSAFAPS
jgi:hypothetical protein